MKKIYGLTLIFLCHIDISYAAINCATQCTQNSPAANITIDPQNPKLPPETLACLQECPISELSGFLLQLSPALNHPNLWKMIGELDPKSNTYKEAMQERCDIAIMGDDPEDSPEIDQCHLTSNLEVANETSINGWIMSQDPSTLKGLISIAHSLPKEDPDYNTRIQGLLRLIKRIIQVDTNEINDEEANNHLMDLEKVAASQ